MIHFGLFFLVNLYFLQNLMVVFVIVNTHRYAILNRPLLPCK